MLLGVLPLLAACTAAPVDGHVVVFSATGSTERAFASYAVFGDESTGPVSGRVALPWSRTVETPRGASGDLLSWSLSVTDRTPGAELTCEITVDGRRLAAERAAGGATCAVDLREP